MKRLIELVMMFVAVFTVISCDPIEDNSLRDSKINGVGTPITAEELKAALSMTQLPNQDGVVIGDQYIIVKNSRPDIGGRWHLLRGAMEKTYGTDNDTIICSDNGDYQLYYEGISANTIVKTAPFEFTVTNVFDPWSKYFTNAVDKADKTAKKTWRFRQVSWGSVCNMGAHGGWKYTSAGYTPESNFAWWANVTLATAGDQKMVFEYDGNKLTNYKADGTVRYSGNFSFTHNQPETGVLGELITSCPVIGSSYDDEGQSTKKNNTFWLLTLTDDYITLYHPDKYKGGGDWDDSGWYVYYKCDK